MKIKSRQEKTTPEKPFIGTNVATPEVSTGECLLTDLQSEQSSLLI
jgi:hypothetical protein